MKLHLVRNTQSGQADGAVARRHVSVTLVNCIMIKHSIAITYDYEFVLYLLFLHLFMYIYMSCGSECWSVVVIFKILESEM